MFKQPGIYLWSDGIESGPFRNQEIVHLLAIGRVQSDSFARLVDDDEWSPLSDVLTRLTRIESAKFLAAMTIRPEVFHAPDVFPSTASNSPQVERRSFAKVFIILLGVCLVGVSGWVLIDYPQSETFNSVLGENGATYIEPEEFEGTPVRKEEPALIDASEVRSSFILSASTVSNFMNEAATTYKSFERQTKDQSLATSLTISPLPKASQPLISVSEKNKNDEEMAALPTAVPKAEAEVRPTESFSLHALSNSASTDFFRIDSIKVVLEEPRMGAAWLQIDARRLKWKRKIFVPYIEVTVRTAEKYESKNTFLRVHVFDSNRGLISTLNEPAIAWRDSKQGYGLPPLFSKGTKEKIYFALPDRLIPFTGSLLAVFGDVDSATTFIYPQSTSTFGLDFPERGLVDRSDKLRISRKAAVNPVLETVVETRNPKQPIITLFMRSPSRVNETRHVKGILAMCLLASNAEEIRKIVHEMDGDEDGRIFEGMKKAMNALANQIDPTLVEQFKTRMAARQPSNDEGIVDDMRIALEQLSGSRNDKTFRNARTMIEQLAGRISRNKLVKFANTHDLAILVWGSRRLWNPKLSFDEQTRSVNQEMDDTFEDVAKAWERGLDQFSKKYGFPNRNILLTGFSGAAQYACRLALRKPERFLAAHVHIPSSFDRPTMGANQLLWLLTTGENEGGYPAAKRFFIECKKLGYPIIFKAIPGLGHAGSRATDDLGLAFFEYALTLQGERDNLSQSVQPQKGLQGIRLLQPWPQSFKTPESIGDILNQEIFSSEDASYISIDLRVALPTTSIAQAWIKE